MQNFNMVFFVSPPDAPLIKISTSQSRINNNSRTTAAPLLSKQQAATSVRYWFSIFLLLIKNDCDCII